jgi:hypothetical protein
MGKGLEPLAMNLNWFDAFIFAFADISNKIYCSPAKLLLAQHSTNQFQRDKFHANGLFFELISHH